MATHRGFFRTMPRPKRVASATASTTPSSGSVATIERSTAPPGQTGVLWKSAQYQFVYQPTGLICEMEMPNGWITVSSVPVSVIEQFLISRGLIKPALTGMGVHATNGAARTTRTRSPSKTATGSRV